MDLLEQRAGEEGLFRVSGSARAVRRLALRLDEGAAADPALERAAAHDLASLLKRLLADAPPLLGADGGPEPRPPALAAFARFLLSFLGRVAARASSNRMTAANLAVVWTPVLARVDDLSRFAPAHDLVLRLIQEHVPAQ